MDNIKAASDVLRELVERLATELPGITFGYIGNVYCGPYYDDRSWRIFLPHPGRVGTFNDSVSIGPTSKLAGAVVIWAQLEAEVRLKYAKVDRTS